MDILNGIPIVVLLAVFAFIAIRQIGRIKLPIWLIMLGGAVVVLVTVRIYPLEALRAIDIDVMLFLFGMFIVGEALFQSGYLFQLSNSYFNKAKDTGQIIISILFGIGLLSAILMTDTLAIIGTPLVLYLAKKHRLDPKMMLMALAIAVTTGSVMSPIGNPQNLLVALSGRVQNPFITFFAYLAIPTFISLLLAYLALRVFYRGQFKTLTADASTDQGLKDPSLARLCKISLVLILALIALKIDYVFMTTYSRDPGFEFRLTYIALAAAFPIIAFSPRRLNVLRRIDWTTLVFFAAMFILMQSVWNSGFFQDILGLSGANITYLPVILGVSVGLSQVLSNVPFVALYIPLLTEASGSTAQMMALAAGSTIAGNLFILGAASNVIIIQNAEKQGKTLTFIEFARVGVPLTIAQVLVYWGYLAALDLLF